MVKEQGRETLTQIVKQFAFSRCIDFESKSHLEVSAAFGALFGGFLADLMGRLGNDLAYFYLHESLQP